MSDLISREAAIDAINRVMADYIPFIWRFEELPLRVEGEIEKLPSAQHWIPVSERLPEKSGFALCSHPVSSIGICYFEAAKNMFISDYNVTAWMPLPTPYQGGTE